MAPVLNLNNEVVKMRKDVKKVKVLIIRKLTRHISRLKSKKGSEELIQKNQRRVQRLLEEVQTIKKLKPDDVTKTALLKEISFEKECKKPNSTIETRAVARLATHPLLKQKISSIKDAIKAFKEARKNTEQEAKKEENVMASEHSDIRENISKHPEKPCKQGKEKQKLKAVVRKPEEGCSKHLPRKTPHKDGPSIIDNQRPKVAKLSAQKNGQVRASSVVPQPSAEIKPIHSIAEKIIDDKPENAMHSIPEQTIDDKAENATHTVPENTVDDKPENATHSVPEKTVDDKPENAAHSVPEKTVDDEPKYSVRSVPEQIIDDEPENDDRPGKKTSPLHISGSDSSDIEDSGKEDKEYFDDSTEERFYKKAPDFGDTDSDSGDDFFLGKVRQTKQKKSHKTKVKVEKAIQTEEKAKPLAGSSEGQKGSMAPKTGKLESVFCGSLSVTKQKPPFRKSEPKFQPIRNRKAAVPQGNKPKPQPQPTRSTNVKMQSKPEPALHPSWEASKKRKEQSQITVFQGKKIVFDD